MRVALSFLLALLLPATAFAEERPFTLDDYASYFSPGRFASQSNFYASEGVMEIMASRRSRLMGAQLFDQSLETLEVMPNYDLLSERPHYKIRSISDGRMIWDAPSQAWMFRHAGTGAAQGSANVWESFDSEVRISVDDIDRGDLEEFYRRADVRAEREPDQVASDFNESITGLWSWSCVYLAGEPYDVRCLAVHAPTGRVEDHSYRRMDLMS